MNKLLLGLGVLSLVFSAVGTVLVLVLPPESFMFDIGFGNWLWGPPVIFFIVGAILLVVSASKKRQAEAAQSQPQSQAPVDPAKAALNKRLENIAWGCFLLMLAGFILLPDDKTPNGLWSIGVGIIMLGLNLVRYFNKLKMSGFTTFLGILSLVGGITDLLGWTNLQGAWLLLILGAYLIFKSWFDKNKLFGKAEEA